RSIRLPETIEHVRQKVRPDAHTAIAHHDLDVRIDPLQPDLDHPALVRKLHAVRQEVPNHLLQTLAIAKHWSSLGLQQHLKPHTLRFRSRPNTLCRGFNHRIKFTGHEFESQLARD